MDILIKKQKVLQRKWLKKTKKILLAAGITAGVTAAAAGAKYIQREYMDTTLKKGKKIQTLSNMPDRLDVGESYYTAYKKGDKLQYQGMYGRAKTEGGLTNKKAITGELANKVKIPSNKKAEKIFKELQRKDPAFKAATKDTTLGQTKSSYEQFNTYYFGGVNPAKRESAKYAEKKFIEELKAKGYGGIKDINDQKYSGFNTKAVILFKDTKLNNKAVRDLTNKDIKLGRVYSTGKITKDVITNPMMATSGVLAGGRYVLDRNDKKRKKRRK